jgi:hypothetical protein
MPKSRRRKPIDHQHRLRMEKRTQRAARHRRQRSATQACSRRRIHPACQPAATPGCGLPNFQKAVMRQKLGPHLEDVRGARPDTPIKVCRRESKVRFTGTSTKSTGLRAHLIRFFCALESIVFCLDEFAGPAHKGALLSALAHLAKALGLVRRSKARCGCRIQTTGICTAVAAALARRTRTSISRPWLDAALSPGISKSSTGVYVPQTQPAQLNPDRSCRMGPAQSRSGISRPAVSRDHPQ